MKLKEAYYTPNQQSVGQYLSMGYDFFDKNLKKFVTRDVIRFYNKQSMDKFLIFAKKNSDIELESSKINDNDIYIVYYLFPNKNYSKHYSLVSIHNKFIDYVNKSSKSDLSF